jgi:hypothetical protein
MRKILILLSLFTFPGFNIKAQNAKSSPFIKEYHNFKTDTSIVVAVPYKGSFYCLKSNGGILIIDAQNNLLECPNSDNSTKVKLTNLYLEKGLLIAIDVSKTYYLNKKSEWKTLRDSVNTPPIFEDQNFIVTSACRGEWGGSLFFLSKKSNKIYECSSTCSVNIIKLDDKYTVTASLAHLAGFANIFEIDNPEKLKVHNHDTRFVIQSNSIIGTNQLIDSIGIESCGSFIYKNQIFNLICQNNSSYRKKSASTFITTIKNKKLITIDTIANFSMWSYDPIYRSYSNQTICNFANDEKSGFVVIADNKLTLYTFDWKHK